MAPMTPTIFVGSYKGSPFLQGCLDSIPADCSCIVVRNDGYECGCLRWVQENYAGEKFLFLQDSARIKNPKWVYECFADGRSYSLNNETGWGSMFSAVYRMEIVRQLKIPDTRTKREAVFAEMELGQQYIALDPEAETLWPELRIENAHPELIFGQERMIYENEYFWKAKGCWGGWMLEEVQARDERTRVA